MRADCIAVIPARGGSKRLPGKNIKRLGGRPLIAWTIQAALDSGCFSRVLVSTDDEAIAAVARDAGADVPWLRPATLASDTASTVDVLIHAVEVLHVAGQAPSAVALLQPTSPFRRVSTLVDAVSRFQRAGGSSVVSVSPAAEPPAWLRSIASDGTLQPLLPEIAGTGRSQDLPPAYILNGLVYVFSARGLIETRSIYTSQTQAMVIDDAIESLDIDTEIDWMLAETIVRAGRWPR